jgi:hypothetical protein
MIRTPKIPFIHSRASWQLALLTTLKKVFVWKYGELL